MKKEAGFLDWLKRNGIDAPKIGTSAAFMLFSWFITAGGDPQFFIQTVQAAPTTQVAKDRLSKELKRKGFDDALKDTLKFEGGYVNHPKDPGGATNKGITHNTYKQWLKSKKRPYNDVKNITDSEVKEIYKNQYWSKIKGDQIPFSVARQMFDFAVNSGPSRSIKYTQAIVGVKATGIMDDATIKAINKYPKGEKELASSILQKRKEFLLGLKNKTFQKGWLNRVDSLNKHLDKDTQK